MFARVRSVLAPRPHFSCASRGGRDVVAAGPAGGAVVVPSPLVGALARGGRVQLPPPSFRGNKSKVQAAPAWDTWSQQVAQLLVHLGTGPGDACVDEQQKRRVWTVAVRPGSDLKFTPDLALLMDALLAPSPPRRRAVD